MKSVYRYVSSQIYAVASLVAIAGLLLLMFALPVGAATSYQYVTLTATGLAVSISNTPSSHAFGNVEVGQNYTTGTTNFNVTNNSNTEVDITITCTDWTGAPTSWTNNDTAPIASSGVCAMLAANNTHGYDIHIKKTGGNYLSYNLSQSGSELWGIALLTPTASIGSNLVTGNCTLLGQEH